MAGRKQKVAESIGVSTKRNYNNVNKNLENLIVWESVFRYVV